MTPEISVIIVTNNSAPVLAESLPALKLSIEDFNHFFSREGSVEVVVIDNNSSDTSPDIVRRSFPDAKALKLDLNTGFASACNLGAERAKGRYLLLLNPDVVLESEALWALHREIENRSDAGAVCGRLTNTDGSFQATCRNFPDVRNILGSRGSWLLRFSKRNRYTLDDSSEVISVPATAATMLMIKSDVFASHSGFDERFFMYMEDTDLCRRLGLASQKIYYVPTAVGIHKWGQGSDVGFLKRAFWHHLSVWKYFAKWRPGFFTYVVLPPALCLNFLLRSISAPFDNPN
ncbi:MAG: glycosyltransferase family 2 protein [candidate division Zixibacteria bacterium]|nr:glycosyltransferase family 2 protein [candidate division Zixibacteria bacterium]